MFLQITRLLLNLMVETLHKGSPLGLAENNVFWKE